MKKTIRLMLAMFVISMVIPAGLAQGVVTTQLQYEAESKQLQAAGILRGTDQGLELERVLNRVEGSAMLVRLLGEEENALQQQNSHPFQDVPEWADEYVGFLYTNGLTQGISDTQFGSLNVMTATQYTTFILRAIGYDDRQGDFTWQQALHKAAEIGMLTDDEVKRLTSKDDFLRDDMAGVSWYALHTEMKDTTDTLVEQLVQAEALDKKTVFKAGFPVIVTFSEYQDFVDAQQVIAELDGITLTYQEMFEMLQAQDLLEPGTADYSVNDEDILKAYILELTAHKYLIETAVAKNFVFDKSIVQSEMDRIIEYYAVDITAVEQQLLYNLIYKHVLLNEYMISLVTDKEGQEYYENNLHEFTYASVRHILVSNNGRTEGEALEIAEQLAGRIRLGEDMGELAKEYTEDPGSVETGGLYENVVVANWVQEFREAALNFSINEVGDPVKTEFGYHVIRVEDRNIIELEQILAQLKQALVQEKYRNFIESAQYYAIINL